MKNLIILLSTLTACPALAGAMADTQTSTPNRTYVAVGGGYYSSNYQADYTHYTQGVLTSKESFNDAASNGYGQIGLGSRAHFGMLAFDHQLVISKLGGSESFTTPGSNWHFSQNVDFGYDWMPSIPLLEKLEGVGMLGVHYARFTYQKKSSSLTAVTFNNYKDQIGFNLGAGLNYHLNEALDLGVKYQHWQYSSTQVSGINATATSIDVQQIGPSFNLVGLELHYYLN